MAIYKNREVSIVGPNAMANTPETIQVQYKDGTNENVPVAGIRFTKEEKNSLLKNYPSKFESVQTVEDKDLEAVRVGVAPSFDESAREQAKTEVQAQKQAELHQNRMFELKKDEEKKFDAKVKAPAK